MASRTYIGRGFHEMEDFLQVVLSCFMAVVMLGSSVSTVMGAFPPELGCSKLLSLPLNLSTDNVAYAGADFGLIRSLLPAAVLYPGSVQDIVSAVDAVYSDPGCNLTIAARGPGHSVNGQSQALAGLVIEMSAVTGITVDPTSTFVDANAGELWVDVLQATLKAGLTPKSFTDYLHLSVGGTLSNAGVSGQAYRVGPQINNVLQLDVITGTGQLVTCSSDVNPDLFFAVLGGLGQFGIITSARISLQLAPPSVRWIRAIYSDFATLKADQELLIAKADDPDTFDYVEGFVIANTDDKNFGYNSVPFAGQTVNLTLMPDPAATKILFYIELAKSFDSSTEPASVLDQKIADLLAPLKYISTQVFYQDVAYFDFLERVYATELILRSLGEWDVPHPWLNIFVPASKILDFHQTEFLSLDAEDINGPIIVYPVNGNKWDSKMSAVVPSEEVFYLVAFLQPVLPPGPSLQNLLQRNEDVTTYCLGLGCKKYLPQYSTLADWQTHYGDTWSTFLANKQKFDPQAILAPGQNIFVRGNVPT